MPTPTFTTPARPPTWLITGCSSGFGLALSREALSYRHIVVATSRNPSRNPKLIAETESNGGKWLALDITARDCGKLVKELEASSTHINVLIKNAGRTVLRVVEQLSDEAMLQMELRYFVPYRLIRAVLPRMRKRRFGIIVNISSGAHLNAASPCASTPLLRRRWMVGWG